MRCPLVDWCRYTTCLTQHQASTAFGSGNYSIDLDGPGVIAPLNVYCDMSAGGGGWTLVLSTSGGLGTDQLTAGEVMQGDAKYMPTATMLVLAGLSTQVHLRTTGDLDRSITSVPDSQPIINLRSGYLVNRQPWALTDWTGPFAATDTLLWWSCGVDSQQYPSIYWACGNQDGLHLVGPHSRWEWQAGNTAANEPMEFYGR